MRLREDLLRRSFDSDADGHRAAVGTSIDHANGETKRDSDAIRTGSPALLNRPIASYQHFDRDDETVMTASPGCA